MPLKYLCTSSKVDDHFASPEDLSQIPNWANLNSIGKPQAVIIGTSTSIPRVPQLDAVAINDAKSLIISQFGGIAQRMLFRRVSHIEDGLTLRINSSNILLWTMYLKFKVLQVVSTGSNAQHYLSWIIRFSKQLLDCSPPTQPLSSGWNAELAGLEDLAFTVCMIADTSTGYSLFKMCAPAFLRSATRFPELWSENSAIAIPKAIQCRDHEIRHFAFHDTVFALALGILPLINYDTTTPWVDEGKECGLEFVYGVPVGLILQIAKVNSSRATQLIGRAAPHQDEWREIESHIRRWNPSIDRTEGPSNTIVKFVVQECWRQTTLIYLYMCMCKVDSADPRVESAVRQVIQLASIMETFHPLKSHLFIPCLVAGVAARHERHRALICNKISALSNSDALALGVRGADFIPVLDHLWHSAASSGKPVTWEDYVQSRCAVLLIAS
ncbi:hypothetical protein CTheo_4452 [Ceratobasidium theobromae]|uniref:Fungal zn(2)-cys(6) binuclear cluster domain containing protein n=1 Tax=Ceratobasidium theobromae TaxID=1582974 RepID=A0A5N5QKY0_9AGAM|nr:hypothetical protein CTheo_4452 [Ceratobasidium theobromae]